MRNLHTLGLDGEVELDEGLWVGGGLGLEIGELGLDRGMGLDVGLGIGGGLGEGLR